MTTKTKKPKKPPVDLDYTHWGVSNYGVTLLSNCGVIEFPDGSSLDVEYDDNGGFIGIGLYNPETKMCHWYSDWEQAKMLTIPRFIAHNGRSDIERLQVWGFKVSASHLLHDTMLYAHILDSSRGAYGLKKLASADVGISYPSYEDLCGKKGTPNYKDLGHLPPELTAEYNGMDCLTSYKLYEKQHDLITGGHMEDLAPEVGYFNTIEKPAAFVFQRMERRGLRLDLPYLNELKDKLEAKKAPIMAAIQNDLGTINLNSPKQLLEALHAKEIKPMLKGKPSTDKRALSHWSGNPIVSRLLAFSEVETLLSSFVYPYLERGVEVVHPNFNQCGTRTGRPSCSNPNLLQIPRRTENGKLVRRMFIPREGMVFGDCDFGQIEPRLLAHLSRAKSLCELFNKDIDFHTHTAERLSIDRERAKILNLSVGYRATKFSVADQLKCSLAEAQREIDAWWNLYPDLWDWEQKLIYECKKSGFFTTLMGRQIKVEDINHGNERRRAGAERQLINNIAQASAAEVMKLAMIKADAVGIGLLVQVYDELLLEEPADDIDNATRILVDCMEQAATLEVPLVVDAKTGTNWCEVH